MAPSTSTSTGHGQEASDNDDNTSDALYAYRGGFSTSIVDDLFAQHGHSDCCALTCCGILLYDRNTFLLTGQRPSWKRRCLGGVVLLALMIYVAVVASASPPSTTSTDSRNSNNHNDAPDGDDQHGSNDTPSADSAEHMAYLLIWFFVGLSFYFLYMLADHRFYARRALMTRMYDERGSARSTVSDEAAAPTADHDTTVATATTPLVAAPVQADVEEFLKLQDPNIRSATSICGCIPKDAILPVDAANGESTVGHKKGPQCGTDLCHGLWKAFSCLCCGGCCGCWCQCVGLCATAQEDRELQRMLPREKFLMDYITFQPFEEYAPKLKVLRETQVNNILKHMEALSQLSKLLLRVLLLFLGCLTAIALTGMDPSFQPIHLAVVVLVLFQAFIIVYFVHWQFYRFDLSLDAVVKYFASGFILCTANAFVYEMLVSTALGIGSSIVRIVIVSIATMIGRAEENGEIASVNDDALTTHDDFAVNASGDVPEDDTAPLWLLALAAFLNAFAVAAMVEEVSKYFGFWMVEHPDLLLDRASGEGEDTTSRNTTQSSAHSDQRSLRSVGAGITIAMVTTAVGFACCENFMYVFLYTRPSNPTTEISTLLARSIFPVHPLAAAIQSIGVCRRDIERDSSMGFGRILFPALLLHGFFDFALMFLELISRQSSASNDGKDGTPAGGSLDGSNHQDDDAFAGQLPGLISSVCIVVVGILYYIFRAVAQRRRLVGLDESRQRGDYEQLI